MSWKYNNAESDVLWGSGAPTATRLKPTLYIDCATGLLYVNPGQGSTWRISNSSSGSVTTLTAASTLTAADSGKVFLLNSATEFDTILPALASGLRFKFICAAAPSGASYTITPTDADKILGGFTSSDLNAASDADFEASGGGDVVTFVDSKAVAGDWVEFVCDGTNWYVSGCSSVFDALTITG